MINKYFNVEVKPTILASQLAAHAYGSGDVVFDWHAVDVPKGASKLVGVTAIMRQKHGTAGNEFPFQLVYAKSIGNVAPSSLGTGSATANGTGYYNNVIGKSTFIAKDYMSNVLDNGVVVAALTQGGADSEKPSIILEGEPNSGTNVGYDKLYVGMIAEGAFDFTTAALTDAIVDVSGLSAATITTIDGTAADKVFAVGDVLHAQDDVVIGEITSLDADNITLRHDGENGTPANFAAWQVQNGAGTAGDLADGDELINVNPIKIILHFEK